MRVELHDCPECCGSSPSVFLCCTECTCLRCNGDLADTATVHIPAGYFPAGNNITLLDFTSLNNTDVVLNIQGGGTTPNGFEFTEAGEVLGQCVPWYYKPAYNCPSLDHLLGDGMVAWFLYCNHMEADTECQPIYPDGWTLRLQYLCFNFGCGGGGWDTAETWYISPEGSWNCNNDPSPNNIMTNFAFSTCPTCPTVGNVTVEMSAGTHTIMVDNINSMSETPLLPDTLYLTFLHLGGGFPCTPGSYQVLRTESNCNEIQDWTSTGGDNPLSCSGSAIPGCDNTPSGCQVTFMEFLCDPFQPTGMYYLRLQICDSEGNGASLIVSATSVSCNPFVVVFDYRSGIYDGFGNPMSGVNVIGVLPGPCTDVSFYGVVTE
jgi:hypothetical protein